MYRVQREDDMQWIEKIRFPEELSREAAVLDWCLPVYRDQRLSHGKPVCYPCLCFPGVNLTEVSMRCAVAVLAETLRLIHGMPVKECRFQADWPPL
jgi:aminoglycoside phosphotransferase